MDYTRKLRTLGLSDPTVAGTAGKKGPRGAAGTACITFTGAHPSDAPVLYVNIGSNTITATRGDF